MNGLILKVYFFLATTCPISQQYTAYINQFTQAAKAKGIKTLLVFPTGKTNISKEIYTFQQKYSIIAPVKMDRQYKLTKQLNASVTPEVFVLNDKNEILYHGAIDNWYYALGQNRINVTAHYLDDAIHKLMQSMPVQMPFVKPVGCFIETGKSL